MINSNVDATLPLLASRTPSHLHLLLPARLTCTAKSLCLQVKHASWRVSGGLLGFSHVAGKVHLHRHILELPGQTGSMDG